MLKERIYTAIVLIGALLGSLFLGPPWLFLGLMLLFLGLAFGEWARLNSAPRSALIYAIAGVLLAWGSLRLTSSWPMLALFGSVSLFWGVLAWYFFRHGHAAWGKLNWKLRLLLGWLILIAAWLCLPILQAQSPTFLLSALSLIWLADVGAYFFGRQWGGRWFSRKLAPSISPKKTWEGVVGGLVFMLLGCGLWLWLENQWDWPHTFVYFLFHRFGALGLVLCCAAILLYSIIGDLFESLVKRNAGAKDSSQLLPGHGGVLDRLDALLPTLPLLVVLMSL